MFHTNADKLNNPHSNSKAIKKYTDHGISSYDMLQHTPYTNFQDFCEHVEANYV